MQTGDREVAREIRAVFRQEHVCVLHILFFDGRDFVRGWQWPEMWPIHRRIGRISINRIERDLVLFNVGIVQGVSVVKVPGNFLARRETLLEQMSVAEILFIFPKRVFLNERAEVVELLRPFVAELDHQEDDPAKNGQRHVDFVPGQVAHFQRRPGQDHRNR